MLIKLLAFVAYFSLQLSVRVEAVVVCPPADVISPCTCRRYSTRTNSTFLNCGSSRNLADSQVNDILDAYLATPNVSPVGRLQLSNNALLTRVPVQVKYFTQLEYADLYFNPSRQSNLAHSITQTIRILFGICVWNLINW